MTPVVVLPAVMTAVAAAVDWWAVAPPGADADERRRRAEAVAKPATLLLLTATALAAGAAGTTAGRWLVAALLLGTVGDVMLLARTEGRFLAGLAAFWLGHTAYLAAFVALGVTASTWVVGGAVVLLGALVAGRDVVPAAWRSGGAALAVPVGLYMLVIASMLLAGWALESAWLGVGASVFVASDTVLARDRWSLRSRGTRRLEGFVRPGRWAHLTVMVTYHVGQALLVVGILVA